MLDAEFIVSETLAWSFPVIIDLKWDKYARSFVDYWLLNKKIKADRQSIPNIVKVCEDLSGCMVFTTAELFSGY